MPPTGHTIQSLRESFASGALKPQEVAAEYLLKAKAKNSELNAFLSFLDVTSEKTQGSLAGIPCALKDNILVEGTIATAGSKVLENYVSSFDATVTERLKHEGAVIIGKTNLDEFAMGGSTENSAYGPVKNPLDLTRVPGGSSGGSVAAVAADLAVFALGSDTGGSIRQPASLCGVVGLKPTYGRVSRHGLIAMASSLDQIGPVTKTVYDTALVLNAIAGRDEMDATTVPLDVPDFTKNLTQSIQGMRIGVPREFFGEGLSDEVRERVETTIATYKKLGAEVIDISLPHAEYALAVYYIVMPCEVSANLSRFDGIRYGYSTKDAKNLLETYLASRAEGLGAEVKRRIMLGTYALSAGYFDAYYLKAQKVRNLIRKDFDEAFKKVDVILGPTSPTVAFKIGEKSDDPLAMYLCDIYTVPVNLAGVPAISVPAGVGRESGLPVGVQLIGNMFQEQTILQAAYQLEQALL